jgi:general secretion pathway protein K
MATIYRLIQRRAAPPLKQLELQGPPDPIDLGLVSGVFGDGEYEVEIQDESAKVNLNFVQEDQLKRLIEFLAIPRPDSDIIVDSILDWKDVDPGHRLNGAEDDFYQTLNPPYKAKNNRFDSVEELLLVRGVTPDYFYGHREKGPDGEIFYQYGLSRCFTVFSNVPLRVNINYAPLPVLMSIPGMTPQLAQAITEKRKTEPFDNAAQISQAAGVPITAETLPYLATDQTGAFTLTASGRRAGSKVRRTIRAVIVLDPREAVQYRILYWNESVPNL